MGIAALINVPRGRRPDWASAMRKKPPPPPQPLIKSTPSTWSDIGKIPLTSRKHRLIRSPRNGPNNSKLINQTKGIPFDGRSCVPSGASAGNARPLFTIPPHSIPPSFAKIVMYTIPAPRKSAPSFLGLAALPLFKLNPPTTGRNRLRLDATPTHFTWSYFHANGSLRRLFPMRATGIESLSARRVA